MYCGNKLGSGRLPLLSEESFFNERDDDNTTVSTLGVGGASTGYSETRAASQAARADLERLLLSSSNLCETSFEENSSDSAKRRESSESTVIKKQSDSYNSENTSTTLKKTPVAFYDSSINSKDYKTRRTVLSRSLSCNSDADDHLPFRKKKYEEKIETYDTRSPVTKKFSSDSSISFTPTFDRLRKEQFEVNKIVETENSHLNNISSNLPDKSRELISRQSDIYNDRMSYNKLQDVRINSSEEYKPKTTKEVLAKYTNTSEGQSIDSSDSSQVTQNTFYKELDKFRERWKIGGGSEKHNKKVDNKHYLITEDEKSNPWKDKNMEAETPRYNRKKIAVGGETEFSDDYTRLDMMNSYAPSSPSFSYSLNHPHVIHRLEETNKIVPRGDLYSFTDRSNFEDESKVLSRESYPDSRISELEKEFVNHLTQEKVGLQELSDSMEMKGHTQREPIKKVERSRYSTGDIHNIVKSRNRSRVRNKKLKNESRSRNRIIEEDTLSDTSSAVSSSHASFRRKRDKRTLNDEDYISDSELIVEQTRSSSRNERYLTPPNGNLQKQIEIDDLKKGLLQSQKSNKALESKFVLLQQQMQTLASYDNQDGNLSSSSPQKRQQRREKKSSTSLTKEETPPHGNVENLERTISELKLIHGKQDQKIADLKNELKSNENDKNESKEKFTHYRKEMEETLKREIEVIRLEYEKELRKNEIAAKEYETARLKQELKLSGALKQTQQLNDCLESRLRSNKELHDTISSLEQKLRKKDRINAELHSELESFKGNTKSKEVEFESSIKHNLALEKHIKEKESMIDSLKDKLNSVKNELQVSHNKMIGKVIMDKYEVEMMEQKVNRANKIIEEKEDEQKYFVRGHDPARSHHALKEVVDVLKRKLKQNEDKVGSVNELENQIVQLTKEKGEFNKEKSSFEHINKEKDERIQNIVKEAHLQITKLKKQLINLNQEKERVETKYKENSKLLSKAESIMAKTNQVTLNAIMDAIQQKTPEKSISNEILRHVK